MMMTPIAGPLPFSLPQGTQIAQGVQLLRLGVCVFVSGLLIVVLFFTGGPKTLEDSSSNFTIHKKEEKEEAEQMDRLRQVCSCVHF